MTFLTWLSFIAEIFADAMEELEHIFMCCEVEITIVYVAIAVRYRVVLVYDTSDLDDHTFHQLYVLPVVPDHFDFLA